MVAKYRSVLAVPGSPALIVSALLARLPLGMYSLGFLLLVRGTGHSYAVAGVTVGAFAFANAASAPPQGRLVDRFGRARVLPPFALLQAIVLIAFVLASNGHAGDPVLVVLAGLAGALMPPVSPTARALMREVFPDPVIRDTAYALDSVVQEVVWISGPLLVSLVVEVTSPSVAVLMLAVVCVTGTLVFVRSPLARGSGTRAAHEPRQAVLANAELRILMAPVALMGVGLGAIEVGLPSLALHAGSRAASGLLLAMWSLGSMTGGLWYGARIWHSSITSRYRVLFLVAVAFSAPLIIARTIPEGVIGAFLAGLAIAPVFSCQYSLVGRAATAGAETEAFTWVSAALVGGLAFGSAIGGALIGSVGTSAPFVFSCCATAVAALLALRAREPVAA
jgi:MFS family permease